MPATSVSPHVFPFRVYYEDTDFSGSVYHSNYLRFFERARSELLREIGIDQLALFETAGMGFVVRSLNIDYLKPARMDDLIRVETVIERLGRASIELLQEIRRNEDQLAVCKIRLALVARGRPQPFPAEIYARLAGVFAASGGKGALAG